MEKSEPAASFLSDHPPGRMRLEMVRKFDNREVTPIMTQEEWGVLKGYCGGR